MSENILKKVFIKYAAKDKETALEAAEGINDNDFFVDFFRENEKLIPIYMTALPKAFTLENRFALYQHRPNLLSILMDLKDDVQRKMIFDDIKEHGDEDLLSKDVDVLERDYSTELLDILTTGTDESYDNIFTAMVNRLTASNEPDPAVAKALISCPAFKKQLDDAEEGDSSLTALRLLKAYLRTKPKPERFKSFAYEFFKSNATGKHDLFGDILRVGEKYLPEILNPDYDIVHEIYRKKPLLVPRFYQEAADKDDFVSQLKDAISNNGDDATDYRIFAGMETKHISGLLPYMSAHEMDFSKILESLGPDEFKEALYDYRGNSFYKVMLGLKPEEIQSLNLDWDKLSLASDDYPYDAYNFFLLYKRSGYASWVKALIPRVLGILKPSKGRYEAKEDDDEDDDDEQEVVLNAKTEGTKLVASIVSEINLKGNDEDFKHLLDLFDISEKDLVTHDAKALIDHDYYKKEKAYLIFKHPEIIDQIISDGPESKQFKTLVDMALTAPLIRSRLLTQVDASDWLNVVNVNSALDLLLIAMKEDVDISLTDTEWEAFAKKLPQATTVEKIAPLLNELGDDASVFTQASNHNIKQLAGWIANPTKIEIREVNDRVTKFVDLMNSKTLLKMLEVKEFNVQAVAINKLLDRKSKYPKDVVMDYLERMAEHREQIGEYNKATIKRLLTIPALKSSKELLQAFADKGLLPRFKKAIDPKTALKQDVISDEKLDLLQLLLPLAR